MKARTLLDISFHGLVCMMVSCARALGTVCFRPLRRTHLRYCGPRNLVSCLKARLEAEQGLRLVGSSCEGAAWLGCKGPLTAEDFGLPLFSLVFMTHNNENVMDGDLQLSSSFRSGAFHLETAERSFV